MVSSNWRKNMIFWFTNKMSDVVIYVSKECFNIVTLHLYEQATHLKYFFWCLHLGLFQHLTIECLIIRSFATAHINHAWEIQWYIDYKLRMLLFMCPIYIWCMWAPSSEYIIQIIFNCIPYRTRFRNSFHICLHFVFILHCIIICYANVVT